jgi:hypothetical protein
MVEATEHLERYGWWINELESLGLSIKKTILYKVKYVRIAVKKMTDTVYPYTRSTNQLRY